MAEEKNNPKHKDSIQNAISEFGELDIPSIATSLRDVYKTGGIPLALIFVAAVAIMWLLANKVVEALPMISVIIGLLIVSGVGVFAMINWVAYKKWKDELDVRLENRRLEVDLYAKLTAAARNTQDAFLLDILKYLSGLPTNPDSTPEGRSKEIQGLANSLGGLVREFLKLRSEIELPELTPALPEKPVNNGQENDG